MREICTSILCFFFATSLNSQAISDSLIKSSNSVILYESTKVDFKSPESYNLKFKRTTKILNKKGERHQVINLPFKEGQDKIGDVSIRVYNGEGRLLDSSTKKAMKEYAAGDGYSMVTDSRVLQWSYPTNLYPITIEYTYEKSSKNTLSLPGWYPIENYDVAVVESHYILNTDQNIRELALNLDKYPSITKTEKGYAMHNQVSLNSERYSPSFDKVFPLVIKNPEAYYYQGYRGSFNSWSNYGAWINNNFLDGKTFEQPDKVKADLDKFMGDLKDKKEITKRIYNYVQTNTRYVSISLDEGGLSPMEPTKVHEVKYGDCKALSQYTKCLLELYDVDANYVEVHADVNNQLDLFKDYPSAYPGNHIIINVPIEQDTIWLDCTSTKNPFNYLGTFTDNRLALEINDKGGRLVKTPHYPITQNAVFDTINITVSEDYSAKIDYISHAVGLAIEQDIQMSILSDTETKEYLKTNTYKNQSKLKVGDFKIKFDEEEVSSRKTYQLQLAEYGEKLDEYLLLPVNIKSLSIPKLSKDKNREHDILFRRAYSEQVVYTITLPEAYALSKDPSIQIDNDYGHYSIDLEKTNDTTLKVTKAFKRYAGTHKASEYNKIRNFFMSCQKSEKTSLELIKL